LDGPDGWLYYWHRFSQGTPTILQQTEAWRFGGGVGMVWMQRNLSNTPYVSLRERAPEIGEFQETLHGNFLPVREFLGATDVDIESG